jgi:hypothetical protein
MRCFIVCVFLLIAESIPAQNCNAYIPYSQGTTWEVTNYNSKGKETGKVDFELVNKEEIGGSTKFTVKLTSYDAKGESTFSTTYDAFCKDGIFEFDMKYMMNSASMSAYQDMDLDIDATELIMPPMNAATGTKLEDASMSMKVNSGGVGIMNMTIDITDRVVEANENLETPAGKFDCIKISQNVSTKMMIKVTMTTKEWYSEGVGMVASETYNKKGKLQGTSKLTKLDVK